MSMFRRIWLMVVGLSMAALVLSLMLNILTARAYLEKQLFIKNNDNATALALSMSQQTDKDEVMMQLLLSALFDNGHYQSIVLTDPDGRVMVERHAEADVDAGAPAWFIALFPIQAEPGVAFIQEGWRQFGTITLASHSKFAYRDLWAGSVDFALLFMVGAALAGTLGTLMLRLITRPLDAVVAQARAISERRFISLGEPDVPELRSVVVAMNDMVARVKQMFAEEADRLDGLQRKLDLDPVSALPNRACFMSHLREALASDEAAAFGSVVFVRLQDLGGINRTLGHVDTDRLLRSLGDVIRAVCAEHSKWLPAKLNGPDFALLAEGDPSAQMLAKQVFEAVSTLLQGRASADSIAFHVGAVRYRRGEELNAVLAGADQMLAMAEAAAPNTWQAHEGEGSQMRPVPAEAWRTLISEALAEDRIKLIDYPVLGSTGQPIHREGVIRLRTEADGPWRPAGDFMPFAVRLNLTSSLDLGVVRLALEHLRSKAGDFAVNLTAETISDWAFRNDLTAMLRSEPQLCRRLWIEVPEYGTFAHLEAFRALCLTLKPLGCRIGIEHFGRRLSEVTKLSDLGVDYVKVDSSFVDGLQREPESRELLAGLCKMAHSIGILVIAVGVRSREEFDQMIALGFDGATGPGVVDSEDRVDGACD